MTLAWWYVLVLGATLLSARFLLIWTAILRQRVRLPHAELIDAAEIPVRLLPVLAEAEHRLLALGFDRSHAAKVDSWGMPGAVLVELVFFHRGSSSAASVSPPGQVGEPRARVEFMTHLEDGTVVVTTDCLAHLVPPPPPWRRTQDHYFDNLERQWQAHLESIHRAGVAAARLPNSAEEYLLRDNQNSAASYAYRLERGWLVATGAENEGRYSAGMALRWTPRVLAGLRKCKAARKAQGTVQPAEASVQAAADLAAFERVSAHQPRQLGWMVKSGLFVGSGLVAAIAFGLVFSWETLPVLMGVLLFHELGHFAGMKFFRHGDQQILFLPLLGAVTVGNLGEGSPLQKLIILALGPLPGIVASAGAAYLYSTTGSDLWFQIAVMAFIVNAFNLLPILPFDGGRIVEILFFARYPRARSVFAVASMMVCGLAAWRSGDPVLWVVAAVLAATVRNKWQQSAVACQIVDSLPPGADAQARLQTIFEVLSRPRFRRLAGAARFQMAKSLLEEGSAAKPRLRLTVAGGFAYACILGAIVASPLLYIWGSRPEIHVALLRYAARNTARLVADDGPGAGVEQSLPYTCASDASNLKQRHVAAEFLYRPTVIGSFNTEPAAHSAASEILRDGPTDVRVLIFGRSLFVTAAPGNGAGPRGLAQRMSSLTTSTFVEDAIYDKPSVVAISCRARDATAARALFDEIDAYAASPFDGRNAPWSAVGKHHGAPTDAARLARSTYKALVQHVAQKLNEADFQRHVGAYAKATHDKDANAVAVSRQWFDAQKARLLRSVADEFAGSRQPVDGTLIAAYLDYQKRHTDDEQRYDFYWTRADQPRKYIDDSDNDPSAEDSAELAYAFAVSATVGEVQTAGREVRMSRVVFRHASAGLPALASYLCAQDCADVRYSIGAAKPPDQGERSGVEAKSTVDASTAVL
jgi:Zn-dependent protease